MTTRMQIAFVTAPTVTMKTSLGRKILEIAAVQLHAEEQRIRIYAEKKAQERQALDEALEHAKNTTPLASNPDEVFNQLFQQV